MRTIRKAYSINAPLDVVWDKLKHPALRKNLGAGLADRGSGAGSIKVRTLERLKPERIVQEWNFSGASEPAILVIFLSAEDDVTRLELSHINIPDTEFAKVSEAWDKNYLEPLKLMAEQA